MDPQTKIEWSAVSWYSKVLSIFLFVASLCAAFFFGAWYMNESYAISNIKPEIPVPQTVSPASISFPRNNVKALVEDGAHPTYASSSVIIADYLSSYYRVLKVVDNPYAHNTLVVATERSGENCGDTGAPIRCDNDTSCGSIYTTPKCYFFLEPQDYADTNPSTQFVGLWGPDSPFTGLDVGSVRFFDDHTVEFNSTGGDGPGGVNSTIIHLDLTTGSTTEMTSSSIGKK